MKILMTEMYELQQKLKSLFNSEKKSLFIQKGENSNYQTFIYLYKKIC